MSGLLTCREVADEARVSIKTVQRWVKRGELPAVELPGGRIRIDPAVWAATLRGWAYTGPDNAGGPAQCDLPGPGTGG